MFDDLIDRMNSAKWVVISESEKNEDNYNDYHIIRTSHVAQNSEKTVWHYNAAVEDGDAITVEISDSKQDTDPLKDVTRASLRIDEDKKVIGIDIDGDIVIKV